MYKNTHKDILLTAERGETVISPIERIVHAVRWATRILNRSTDRLITETVWCAGELESDGRTRPYWSVNVYTEAWTWYKGIYKLRVGFGSLSGDQCKFHRMGADGELTIPPTNAVYNLAADPESCCEVADVFLGLATLAIATTPLLRSTQTKLN